MNIWLLLPYKGQLGQNKGHFMPNPASNTILFLWIYFWSNHLNEEVDNDDKVGDGDKMDNKMDDDDWSDNSEPPRKHVKHNSKCHDANPTQLCFYLSA